MVTGLLVSNLINLNVERWMGAEELNSSWKGDTI